MSELTDKVEKLRKELCTGPCGQGSGPMQLAQDRNVLLTEVKKALGDPWTLIAEEEAARIKEFKPTDDGMTQVILEGEIFKRMIMLLGTILKNHPGYVEFRCENKDIGEVLITCQKVSEPTPSEKVCAYRDAFVKLRDLVQGWAKDDIPKFVAMEFVEGCWKEVPNEEKYRDADEDHDRKPVQIEGTDAGESSELPGDDEGKS